MKKGNPILGVIFAIIVAAIFLAVSYPKTKKISKVLKHSAIIRKY